jgi:phosphinothricin acetyltransferase
MDIRAMRAGDADAVLAIYQAGLDTNLASFEITAPDWAGFDAARRPEHRFVAVDGDEVLGWVAVSSVSARAVYGGVVEDGVYVGPRARGRGVGTAPARRSDRLDRGGGVWTIQAGIFRRTSEPAPAPGGRLPDGSGIRERIGRHHGRLARRCASGTSQSVDYLARQSGPSLSRRPLDPG